MKQVQTSIQHHPPTDIILDNLLDAVLIVDKSGSILYANKSSEHLFSKPFSELLQQSFGFPVTPYEVQEIQVMNRTGMLTVQMLASVINWEAKKAYLLSLRDITKQKQMESELEARRKKLEATSQENAQYASLASHDLKEPIRKILIYSDRLLHHSSAASHEKIKTQLEKIHASAHRMKLLISGIAEFSTIAKNSESFIPTDLGNIVKEVSADLELLIKEKQATIEAAELPVVEAVPVYVHQLFLNLVSNAIKYSKENVPPRIRIETGDPDDKRIEIKVSDNGIGFENKYAEKIFQPFARLRSNYFDGTGIGLAICKKIIEVHGGSISVQSVPGEGSEFCFTLLKKSCHIEAMQNESGDHA